jgi:Lar family restriction alleviation protein
MPDIEAFMILKPCPFCGSKKIGFGVNTLETPRWWFVNCTDCLASTNNLIPDNGLAEEESKVQAAEAWNRRA